MTAPNFDNYADTSLPAEVHYKMSAREYHSDADGPRLSQSLATLCVNQSPLHAWQLHPKLGAFDYSYEPHTDDGTIIHSLILEPDSDDILEIDPSTIRTKDGKPAKSPFATEEGKQLRDGALAAGRIPLLSDALGVYRYKAKAIRQRLEVQGVLFDGDSEVVIYWTEETPSGPVRCRCRIDHLLIGADGLIVDLKSTRDAHPRSLKRSIWEYGYDVQQAAYVRAVTAAFPHLAGRVTMLFAFAEIEKPYAVNPVQLSGEFRALGEARWERGRDRWAKCLLEDDWRGYEGGQIEPPAYAAAAEMGEL